MAEKEAERHGVLLLAPTSEGGSWDVIRGGYGPDVEHLDRALASVFSAFDVDPKCIAVGGFSDGASYALSLGIINGALFSDVLAFSPGFAAPTQAEDSPRVFMSHGTEDTVLPIERCSRRLAPRLRQAGFDVDYREFLGGHVVPEAIVEAAFERFLSARV
jgi:predicted esterase